jgi:hypothetical protein
MHLVRYAGVLSAARKLRPLVVPPPAAEDVAPELVTHAHGDDEKPATHRFERFLRHLGEPVDLPPLSSARGPPFFCGRAVRRKLGELDEEPRQTEIFGS